MSASRDDFLKEGKTYIEDLLDEKANYQVSLKYEKDLADIIQSNIDLISDEILSNSKLTKSIKSKVESYSEEIRKLIWATAAQIEQGKFQDVEEVIAAVHPGENEKRKVETLLKGYRKLSFSVETIKVAVEFFSMINQSILDRVRSVSRSSPEYSSLMLKNAILVYEFTGFLIEYLENFGISGIEDIEQVKKDLEERFRKAEESNKKLENSKDLENSDPDLKEQILKNLIERRKIIEMAQQRWSAFENTFKAAKEGAETAISKLIPNLRVRREDSKSQLYTLEVVLLVKAFESNMQLADKLADVRKFELAPLTAEDISQLFGLDTGSYINVNAQDVSILEGD